MKKVLIPTKLSPVARKALEKHGAYEVIQEEGALLELIAAHPDTYALIVRSEGVTAEVIDALPQLKVVVRAGAGYNTIDTEYARKRGIDVMNTPGANSNAVAEEVVALMLADARHLIPADASCRAGKWEKSKFMGREITGKTLGILGLGHIGRLLATRLSGFDMRIIAYDPVINAEKAEALRVELVELNDVFLESDYISLHIPENAHTRGLINEELLSMMKPGAALINCARAGILNEDDLRKIKSSRGIRLLNDVYAKDAAGDKSIADIADIMVPHLGASTAEANENAAKMAASNLIGLDDKGVTSYVVNRDVPDGLDETYSDLAFTLTRLSRLVIGETTHLERVETSVYGRLKPYADWLVVPMVCAISPGYDRSLDHKRASEYLEGLGIEYTSRKTDGEKRFDHSITVDLFSSEGGKKVSVRGTVAEGRMVVSRINHFDSLYFEPKGHIACFIYKDKKGVLAKIAGALATAGINIDDVRNPHSKCGSESIAILAVNESVPAAVVEQISADIEASVAFCHFFE